jgi:hypothetical protein
MSELDDIIIQFAYVPELDLVGRVTESGPYYCFIEYEDSGILHEEMFNNDDVIFTKTITIPVESEGQE